MTVTPPKAASWSYAEGFVEEDDLLAAARARAEEVGAVAIGSGGGAALRFLASVIEARAVVEVGTGAGVSGLWLLRGMRPDGVLTTIDVENEHQRIARRIFLEAGFASSRTRIITGRALDVLPRLADGVYDLVFVDADATEFGACGGGAAAAPAGRRAGGQRRDGERADQRPGGPGRGHADHPGDGPQRTRGRRVDPGGDPVRSRAADRGQEVSATASR